MIERLILFQIRIQGRKIVRKVLSDVLAQKQIRNLYTLTWQHFQVRKENLIKEDTLGANLTLKLSLLTHIMYEKMLDSGLDNRTSLNCSKQITWKLYRYYAMLAWYISGIFKRNNMIRLKWMMAIFWKYFPYNLPGYDMRRQASPEADFVFHVHRCPAAQYFHSHLLPDLCIETWCNLDFDLAREWELELYRPKTLSAGDEYCDFNFKLP